MKNYLLFFLLFFPTLILKSQSIIPEILITEGWESSDIKFMAQLKPDSIYYSPFQAAGLKLLETYQTKLTKNSIKRCPFHISCSNYTILAIKKYDLVTGTALFIDRTYYREHSMMYNYYPYIQQQDGLLKLNDSYFILQHD